MKKLKKIPTIIGLIILFIGLAAGILIIQNRQIFRLGAKESSPPKDVRITNISESSFTVSWTSQNETGGFLLWGESANSLNKTENDEIGQTGYTHTVTLKGLSPATTHYFKINSGGVEYDNSGIPWETKTGVQLPQPDTSIVISGNILTATGTPAKGAIVYITVGGASSLSTITSQNGSWVVNLSQMRTNNLSSFFPIDKLTLLEIAVQAGTQGTASASIYVQAAKPVPPIILGQVHDFKNLPPSTDEELPTSNVQAPTDTQKESGFDISGFSATPSSSQVTIDSIDEGEVITTQSPEFFGDAPPGTRVTVSVESDPQSEVITAGTSGDWAWTPPEDLDPGLHKITLNWRDENGILRSIKKTFIVQAAEGPAFVATPSASPTTTARATTTPRPTSTASATPRTTATASAAPKTPDSGIPAPTLFMLIIGLILFTTGGSILFSLVKDEN